MAYFTLIIPYSAEHVGNPWTPDTNVGPFATRTCGAFNNAQDAHKWASDRLEGAPYSVRYVADGVPVVRDGEATVYLVVDPRGSSESYEGFSLIAYSDDGCVVWTEGVRKDRTAMRDTYRGPVEAALSDLKGEV